MRRKYEIVKSTAANRELRFEDSNSNSSPREDRPKDEQYKGNND